MNNEIALPQNNEIADLTSLAQRINEANQNALASSKKAILYAIECGEALINAKSLVKHGEWQSWLKNNCEVSERTAQNYMKLATEYPSIEDAKAQRVADLSIREAIKELSKPKEVEPLNFDIHHIPDWLPKSPALACVFFAPEEYLWLQEATAHPGFYYIIYFSGSMMDFTIKPIRSSFVEQSLCDWLPGRHTRNCKVRELQWEIFDEVEPYFVQDMREYALPKGYEHLRRSSQPYHMSNG